MRALLSALLCLALVLEPMARSSAQDRPGAAQEPSTTPPDIPPGEDHIESVAQGGRSPFDGMVLDTDTAIRWTNRLRWYHEVLGLRLRQSAQAEAVVQESHARELRLVEASYAREIAGLRSDIREQAQIFARSQEDPAFYETWGFALTLGVVLAGVLVGFTSWALSSVN